MQTLYIYIFKFKISNRQIVILQNKQDKVVYYDKIYIYTY